MQENSVQNLKFHNFAIAVLRPAMFAKQARSAIPIQSYFLSSSSFSSARIERLVLKIMQTATPANAITKKSKAAPEPFPLPKTCSRNVPAANLAMNGSNTLSTRNPPRKYPAGIVKNWNVFRTE